MRLKIYDCLNYTVYYLRSKHVNKKQRHVKLFLNSCIKRYINVYYRNKFGKFIFDLYTY